MVQAERTMKDWQVSWAMAMASLLEEQSSGGGCSEGGSGGGGRSKCGGGRNANSGIAISNGPKSSSAAGHPQSQSQSPSGPVPVLLDDIMAAICNNNRSPMSDSSFGIFSSFLLSSWSKQHATVDG